MSARDAELRAADAAARLAAQREFDRPLVLEAGAGTGKTTVLVARVVAWLLGPGWERASARLAERGEAAEPEAIAVDALRRVVALTFTEAAAAQMASRIGEALLDVVAGRVPLGVHEDALPEAGSRPGRARALVAGLDQLCVRTLHAWCRRLLAEQPLEVGLHPQFAVDADGRRAVEVVREVLERGLPRAWAEPIDPSHRALAEAGIGPAALEEALGGLLDAGLPARALARSPWTREALAELHAALATALEAFLAVEDGALAGLARVPRARQTAAALARLRDLLDEPVPEDAAALAAWVARLGVVYGDREAERLRTWARGRFGAKETAALGERRIRCVACAVALAPLLDHVRRLDPERLECARSALHPLLLEVEEGLRSRGVESFEALLEDARRLLESRPSAAKRVRGGIDQLLVDEFQDTDRTQCAILAALVLDAPASAPRPSLFLVGDPKQSIYGWRNADLAAYDGFVNRVHEGGGALRRLSVSFRSAPPLLDEVQALVEPVMHETPLRQPRFEPLIPAEHRRDDPGFLQGGRRAVEHWVSWPVGEPAPAPRTRPRAFVSAELEARAVAREIAELHREFGVPWRHSALLFRALTDVEIYLEALREAGVPYVVERDPSYYERREVIEASALVRCILDPHDAVALVATLRSAWFGLPDAALLPLWRLGFPERVRRLGRRDPEARASALQALHEVAAALGDALPGGLRLPGWEHGVAHGVEAIDILRRSFEQDPADVFVQRLRTLVAPEASEAARYLAPHRLANLDRFFRDLVGALEETAGDVGAVLAELRTVSVAREAAEGRPRDAADDAVHVLSIHKAKGLDFEHVYLMQLHKPSGGRPPRVRAAETERDWQYRLFDWSTPGFHASAREAEAVEETERVRTLYVALTRACRRLVVCGARSPSARRKDPAEARTHADLLDARQPEPPDLEALFAEAAARGEHRVEAAGTCWVFPALAPPAPVAVAETAGPPPVRADAGEEIRALAAARAEARDRERRPFGDSASRHDPRLAVELRLADAEAGEGATAPARLTRDQAQAVGTALHGALEDLDLGADPAAERAACHARVESLLAQLVGPDQREPARERARELLDAFWDGPLHRALRERAPHLIARELPVLLGPEGGEGPVGFVSGAIDLVYRDPASGELVVADYKTEPVEPGEDLRVRAELHRGQGELYAKAVQQALGLASPPRFELWFLSAGRIEPLPAA